MTTPVPVPAKHAVTCWSSGDGIWHVECWCGWTATTTEAEVDQVMIDHKDQ